MSIPTEEEYLIWRDDPVTKWVMAGVRRYADLQKPAFADAAWASGYCDQRRLDELRTRADAYEGLAGLTYEQARGLHPEEPSDG